VARTNKNRAPALAYLRTSSAANVGTDKDSEKRQRQAIQGFANRAGLAIVEEFYDAAVSGADPIETRAGFAALLDRIEDNGVRTVIVEDASRFARELMAQELGITLLISRGVRLLTAAGDDLTASDDPTRKMMRQIAGAFAEYEKARPHWGRVGKQICEDTGPLDRKRMETIDDETTAAAIDFMGRQAHASKPFFTWMNTTRMHVFTHVRDSMRGQSGMPGNEYADGMVEHDGDVGKLLKALDDLGIAKNTIVIYSTDNGPNQFSWPDAATTPFRSEKDTNWEGAFRVPAMIRWPGHIRPGETSNEMFSGLDWFPTLLAAAGDTTIKDRLLKGDTIGNGKFKVHLDGYNQLPYLSGQQPKSERHEFAYYNDDGVLVAFRHDNWKGVFCQMKEPGGFKVWYEPFDCMRIPKLFNLRMDPYERADIVSDQYDDWRVKNAYLMGWMTFHAAAFLDTFVEYPPSQEPASFTIDQIERDVEAKIRDLARKPPPQ
jgi:Sulfatase/Resolvase, N terminal domain